jgi:hypothetical protein
LGIQTSPDIAFGGGNYFTVWSDSREGYNRVYGARVTTAGVVLEPTGIPIGHTTTPGQYTPVTEFDGSRFLVVWVHSSTVIGRFVGINGIPQDDTVRIVSGSAYAPNIAFDGVNYFIVWLEYTGSSYAISGQFVSITGTLVSDTILIGTATNYMPYNKPGICFDGTNYIITWSSPDDNNIWARIYDTSGIPSGPAFLISSQPDGQQAPDVASGTERYLVTWKQNYDIYGNLDFVIGVKESKTYAPESHCLKTSFVKDYLQIENSENRKITIFDIYGRRIGSTLNGRFDCRNLASGIYFAEVSSVKRFKFVKIK